MLDKRTFSKFLDVAEEQNVGADKLETCLGVQFTDSFIMHTIDVILDTLAESFFTQEQLDDLEEQVVIETVKDIIYHYAFKGEFGLRTGELQRLYVEDEGLATEEAFNAFNTEELYDIIVRYLHPPKVCKTYTLHW